MINENIPANLDFPGALRDPNPLLILVRGLKSTAIVLNRYAVIEGRLQ
jgi:hypothetical protein